MVALGENWTSATYSLITCIFTTQPDHGLTLNTLTWLFSAVTGWDFTVQQLLKVGERNWNMARAFNVREGITRKDDIIPERLAEPILEGQFKCEKLEKKTLEELLDRYYEFRGWETSTGIPTRSKLRDLGIEYVADQISAH
jgi:aldehyde:ferredoxin oxidoreductase